ncbi:MAG TPA: DinB family protein [Gemmatimonadales bacterium]|nr:DinB family protein [Gemmatimonadales bacterium]
MLRDSLSIILRELVHGTAPNQGYVLNPGDIGLVRSLDGLSADAASAPAPAGGASIAAHVDHLRYGFELLNRWSEGEMPFSDADYGTSWQNGTVSPDEWAARRGALAREIARWERVVAEPREMSQVEENGVVASVAHLAYHLGAIRQINKSIQGPRAHPG